MRNNLFLTEVNGITTRSADVTGKVMTGSEKRETETEGRGRKRLRDRN